MPGAGQLLRFAPDGRSAWQGMQEAAATLQSVASGRRELWPTAKP